MNLTLTKEIDIVGTHNISLSNRTLEVRVVRLIVVKVDKEIVDSGISSIVKLTTDFVTFMNNNCVDINQDWIVNSRSTIRQNRDGHTVCEFIWFGIDGANSSCIHTPT